MTTILAVKQNPKNAEQAYVKLDDRDKDAWCPNYNAVKDLVGKPLPEGWQVTEGDYGPRLLPPKERKGGGFGGGAAAFRNTKEGQAIEQERMDRRTALMQAVAYAASRGEWAPEALLGLSDHFYEWLRATAGPPAVSTTGAGTVPTPSPAPTPVPQAGRNSGETTAGAPAGREQGSEAQGEGVIGPCSHQDTSPLKPDGSALPAGYLRCLKCGRVAKG